MLSEVPTGRGSRRRTRAPLTDDSRASDKVNNKWKTPGSRARGGIALGIAVVCSTAMLILPSGGPFAAPSALQHVNVTLSPDAAVTSIDVARLGMSRNGSTTESSDSLVPSEAARDLPVRVRTMWWHDSQTGTDLSELEGRSGRFVLQWSVENLTTESTEVSYESNGAQYRQKELVGVPMTVAASAHVGKGTVDISRGERGKSTDGVVFSDGEATGVQWAALLAPPVLSSTSAFTLVLDSSDFEVPTFDMTVQPGISTDPTIAGLVERAFGDTESSAADEQRILEAVGDVSKELTEARDFVDKVHSALQEDVSSIAGRTFTDLQSSSQQVATGLKTTSDQLAQILASTGSALEGASSSTQSNLRELVSSLIEVIGTEGAPKMSPSRVEGCELTLPQLAEGEDLSVTSSFALLDAQMGALGSLFDSTGADPNCRDVMLATFAAGIGDPNQYEDPDSQASLNCRAEGSSDHSLSCVLRRLDSGVSSSIDAAVASKGSALAALSELGTASLVTAVGGFDGAGGLAGALEKISADAKALQTGEANSRSSLLRSVDSAVSAVEGVQTELEALKTKTQDLENSAIALERGLSSTEAANPGIAVQLRGLTKLVGETRPVGQWFLDSQMVAAITQQANALNASGSQCNLRWSRGLNASSTAEEIIAALERLRSDSCPIESLTGASEELINGYQELSRSTDDLASRISRISAAADLLESDARDLVAAVGELRSSLDDDAELERALHSLYDGRVSAAHPKASGLLAELRKVLEEKNEGSQSAVSPADLVAGITAIWPDSSIRPRQPGQSCKDTQAPVGEAPAAAGQAVVWLTNRLACQDLEATASVNALGDSLEAARTAVSENIESAQSGGRESVNQFGATLDRIGGELQVTLDNQRRLARDNATTLLEDSKNRTDAQLAAALDSLSMTMTSTLDGLNSALSRSTEQSALVASQLSAQFETLLLNLGRPQAGSRLGLIGKLNGVTTDVGETGDVLDGVDTTVTSLGNSRKGMLRRIDLQNAVYAGTEDRLEDYRPFGADPSGTVTTVVTFTMGER